MEIKLRVAYLIFINFSRFNPPNSSIFIDGSSSFYQKTFKMFKRNPTSSFLLIVRATRRGFDCPINLVSLFNKMKKEHIECKDKYHQNGMNVGH